MKMIASMVLAGLMVLGTLESRALAQATTAGIHGVVKDETGAVLPGVTVTARHETGRDRVVTTEANGRFTLTQLPVGVYVLTAELAGFQTQRRERVELTVGLDAPVDFQMTLGSLNESVTVTEQAPLVSTTNSAVGGLVDSKQIRELPLNGRDYMQLALLQAGVVGVRNSNSAPDKGTGVRASFAGARPYQTGFLLDGTDVSTRSNFRSPGSAAGVALGVETVREFQVLVNSFSAEFGNAAGGVINAVSRSGTNELHGLVFEFIRNSELDAKNYFDVGEKPPFKRNQFGFTAGGPAIKNKLFYFGSYEGLRQRLNQTLIARVPTAAAREGRLPTGTVPVADSVKPYLPLWPLPNGRDFGDGSAEFVSSPAAPTDEDFWMARGDLNLSANDALYVRYSRDTASSLLYHSPVPNIGVDQNTSYRFLTVEATRIFTPRALNTFRFAYNKTARSTRDHFFVDIPQSLYFVQGAPTFGSFVFGSNFAQAYSNPGASGRNPSDSNMDLFQVQDTFTLVKGSHNVKVGGMLNRYHLDDFGGNGDLGGQYQFSSLTNLLAGRPNNLRMTAPEAALEHHFRQWLAGVFVQDDWKASDTLTLNVGLRYEFVTEPTETNDQISALIDPLHDTAMTVGAPIFNNPSLKNFAPRFGMAWDVGGRGRTAVRAGFGIFHDQLVTNYFSQVADSNPPFSLRADIANPTFPDATLALGTQSRTNPGPATINIIDPNTKQPYMVQYNVSVQRALGQANSLTIGYVGSHGVNLQREVLVNPPTPVTQADGQLFFPATAVRLNPAFGNIFERLQDGASFYNSLQLKFERRMSQGLQLQSSYTWGKSVDDTSTSHGATDYGVIQVVQHPFDTQFDRGLSNFHVGHSFVVNFNYEVPTPGSPDSVTGKLFGGWVVGGIFNMSSGSPFSPIVGFDVAQLKPTNNGTRPNLAPGASINPINPGNPDQYLDPSAFTLQPLGYLGNLARNTIIGPGLISLDAVIARRFVLPGSIGLELRAEGFNLLNRANFANPSQIVVFDAAGPVRSAGRITSTVTTSRQIQFGLKVTF